MSHNRKLAAVAAHSQQPDVLQVHHQQVNDKAVVKLACACGIYTPLRPRPTQGVKLASTKRGGRVTDA